MNFSKYAPDLRKHQKLKAGEDQEIGSVILLYLSGRSIGSTAAWGASSVQQSSRWADAIYWPDAPIGWPHLLIVAVLGARVLSRCVGGSLRGPGRLEDPSFSFISGSRCALTSPAEEKKKNCHAPGLQRICEPPWRAQLPSAALVFILLPTSSGGNVLFIRCFDWIDISLHLRQSVCFGRK